MKPFYFHGRVVVLAQVTPNDDPDNPNCSQCVFHAECDADNPPVNDLPFSQSCPSLERGVYKEIKP
jgi:hypothetical protein